MTQQAKDTFTLITDWANARNLIDGSDSFRQLAKLTEELGELAGGIVKQLDKRNINRHSVKATPTWVASFDRLRTRRASRHLLTVFLRPKFAYRTRFYGAVVGEAVRLAGVLCQSVNPCHRAALWTDSHSVAM